MLKCELLVISKYAILPGYGMSSKVFSTALFLSKYYDTTLVNSNSNHLSSQPKYDDVLNHRTIETLNIITLGTFRYRFSKSIRRLLSWLDFELKLRSIKIDPQCPPKVVIVSSLSLLTILWALKQKRIFGVKVIFEVRDIYPLTITDEMGVSKLNPLVVLMSWIEKKAYLESDLIVGTMPRLNIHVREVIGFEKEVFYSPIGLNTYFKNAKVNELDLKLPKKYSSSMIIGYSGSIGESNYLSSFIRVIKILRDDPNYYFVILGDGDYLEKYTNDLHNCDNVIFTGRIEPSRVHEYLVSMDCLYLSVKPSSVWNYGQSLNKVLDYLMAGKPIVSAYNGYPNMLNEIEGNLIIPSNDDQELIKAFDIVRGYNQKILDSISTEAPKLVKEKYVYNVINKNYLERITELINK